MVTNKNAFSHVISQLRQSIRQHKLLPKSKKILIALSGGQDSITLSESLRYLHKKESWKKLSLVHCDHKWPGDEGTVELVRDYSDKSSLPLYVIEAKYMGEVGYSENEAREWRYEQMNKVAIENDYNILVTAHTQTDLAETLIYNLSNGCSSNGLSSLTWSRKLFFDNDDDILLIRPLLNITRKDTLLFCQQRNLEFWVDNYNFSNKYKRNRIRSEIIPSLAKHINPNVEYALAKTSKLLNDEAEFMELQIDSIHDKVTTTPDDSDIIVQLDRKQLRTYHIALQRRIIRRILQDHVGLSHNSANFEQVENMRFLISTDAIQSASIPSLTGNTYALIDSDDILSIRKRKQLNHEEIPQDDTESASNSSQMKEHVKLTAAIAGTAATMKAAAASAQPSIAEPVKI